ncbi:MAG: hypothetical protein F7C07_08045 [Desulfurococcales archaeon]|nr:hypothetical protein [Desulfurococcales archaeon]
MGAAAYYNKVLKIGGAPVYYISSVTWSLASKGHDPFISGTCYDAKVYNYVSPSYNVLDTKTVKLNFTSSNWNQLSASLRSRLVTVSASITWGPSWVYLEVPVSLEEVVDVITVKFYTGYDPVFGLGCDNWIYSHTSYPSKSFSYIRLG